MAVRLQVVLARAGCGSRRACEELIRLGVVTVNGDVVTELGTKVEPDDRISVRGKPAGAAQELRTFALNKPREVISTASDPQGRRTVLDFVRTVKERLYPVGRLDYHSEGLILLTNDGELAELLLHPRHGVPRVYLARIKGDIGQEAIDRLASGIRLDGKPTGSIRIRSIQKRGTKSEGNSWVEVTVTEGRYHLVREALLRVGHPVSRLRRVSFGPLLLGRLPVGAVRELSPVELRQLRSAAGTGSSAAPSPSRPAGKASSRPPGKASSARPRKRPSP